MTKPVKFATDVTYPITETISPIPVRGMLGDRIHDLKTWTEYFEAVADGGKTFEIRKNDRDFRVNDVLLLREYDPKTETYSGWELRATVTYITDYGQPPGQVVMAITAGPRQHKG